MPFRTALAAAALGVLAALLPVPAVAGATAPSASADHRQESAAHGATSARRSGAKACRKRLLAPEKPVPASRLASCVIGKLTRDATVSVTTLNTDDKTVARHRYGRTMDVSMTARSGAGFISLGKAAWWRAPGATAWVRAKANGSEQEQLAHLVAATYRATNQPAYLRTVLASSATGYTPTGKVRTISGVRAREYVGSPTAMGVTHSHYSIWLADDDRTVRIDATATLGGVSARNLQTFSAWGKPVRIAPPARG